jgi:hypothetical protein
MTPGFSIDRSDVLALVLMAIFSIRRISVRATDPLAYPQIPTGVFQAWKALAMRARSISVNACFLKFALNSVWFFVLGPRVIPPVLATGGWLIFLGWFGGLMYAHYLSSTAQNIADSLGIVPGTRAPVQDTAPASVREPAVPEEGEAPSP